MAVSKVIFMTRNTYRNNIKPILRGIAFMMMVLFCLFGTVMARQSIRSGQFAISNSVAYSISSFSPTGMCFIYFSSASFTFFCFSKFLAKMISTRFAVMLITIPTCISFEKLRNRFGFLAMKTSFRYDCLKHNRFSNKRLCLEPVAAQTAVGSFYINKDMELVK